MKTISSVGGEFQLPGMEEFVKDDTEYVTVEKQYVRKMAEILELESTMIQALATQCEKQMDVMEIISDKFDPGLKEQWMTVLNMFNERFDGVFEYFLKTMQEIGLNIDVSNIFPEKDVTDIEPVVPEMKRQKDLLFPEDGGDIRTMSPTPPPPEEEEDCGTSLEDIGIYDPEDDAEMRENKDV